MTDKPLICVEHIWHYYWKQHDQIMDIKYSLINAI